MLWEEFKNIAIPILSEHIPAEEIHQEDQLIRFLSKKDRQYYALKEGKFGILIGLYGERNSLGVLCRTPSIPLAAAYLNLLFQMGLNEMDLSIPFSDDLVGPVEGTPYILTREQSLLYRITPVTDPAQYAECSSYRAARMLAESVSASGELP